MSVSDAIAEFTNLLASCEPAWHWEGKILRLKGKAAISVHPLRLLEDHNFIFEFDDDGLNTAFARHKLDELPSGATLNIEVPQQASRLTVVQNLRSLLDCPGVMTGRLNAYIVCDNGVLSRYASDIPDAEAALPENFRRFHKALRLWNLLKDWSDHVHDDGTLLFFGLRRVAIEPGFSESNLPSDRTAISRIEEFIDTKERGDIRKEIFKTVLADQLRDVPASQAFPCLLKATPNFARRLGESLAIYLSEHSPERLQKEAEKGALELSEKLEGIISGLETKSLTVAPALLVAFKEALPGQAGVALNIVTMGAALLYGVSMTWAHHSQKSLIEHVQNLTDDCERDIREQGLSDDNRALKTVFPQLNRRLRHARWGSLVVCILSWLPTAVVIWYAWFGDVPAANNAGGLGDDLPNKD